MSIIALAVIGLLIAMGPLMWCLTPDKGRVQPMTEIARCQVTKYQCLTLAAQLRKQYGMPEHPDRNKMLDQAGIMTPDTGGEEKPANTAREGSLLGVALGIGIGLLLTLPQICLWLNIKLHPWSTLGDK